MKMIRHEQIIADQLGRRFRPSLTKELMRSFIREPRRAVFSRDGQQYDVGLAELNVNAGSGIFALRKFIFG